MDPQAIYDLVVRIESNLQGGDFEFVQEKIDSIKLACINNGATDEKEEDND